jgi:hypothetical protein
VTAIARSLPLSTCVRAEAIPPNWIAMWPPRRSSSAGAGRPVGNVLQLDPGGAVEEDAGEMRRGADPARAVAELAGMRLGVVDELRHGLRRDLRVENEHHRRLRQHGDAGEVVQRVVVRFAKKTIFADPPDLAPPLPGYENVLDISPPQKTPRRYLEGAGGAS